MGFQRTRNKKGHLKYFWDLLDCRLFFVLWDSYMYRSFKPLTSENMPINLIYPIRGFALTSMRIFKVMVDDSMYLRNSHFVEGVTGKT